jgi:serine/threonine protein kinase
LLRLQTTAAIRIFKCAAATSLPKTSASAPSHLHHQGLTHSDLYAHNLLYNNQTALITDFGAASPRPENAEARAFPQSLDLCAYGSHLSELAKICNRL